MWEFKEEYIPAHFFSEEIKKLKRSSEKKKLAQMRKRSLIKNINKNKTKNINEKSAP